MLIIDIILYSWSLNILHLLVSWFFYTVFVVRFFVSVPFLCLSGIWGTGSRVNLRVIKIFS